MKITLVACLLLCVMALRAQKTKPLAPMEHFRVTCPQFTKPGEVVETWAKDRVFAIASIGCTVWTDTEWSDAEKRREENHSL